VQSRITEHSQNARANAQPDSLQMVGRLRSTSFKQKIPNQSIWSFPHLPSLELSKLLRKSRVMRFLKSHCQLSDTNFPKIPPKQLSMLPLVRSSSRRRKMSVLTEKIRSEAKKTRGFRKWKSRAWLSRVKLLLVLRLRASFPQTATKADRL